jgi:hypothetical protein
MKFYLTSTFDDERLSILSLMHIYRYRHVQVDLVINIDDFQGFSWILLYYGQMT